jgi:hypothetical protein
MEKILIRWQDENGDLYRVGRSGSHYFIEIIEPAWEPSAGEVSRVYVSKEEADRFNPDPYEELEMLYCKA